MLAEGCPHRYYLDLASALEMLSQGSEAINLKALFADQSIANINHKQNMAFAFFPLEPPELSNLFLTLRHCIPNNS
jgi:hypothetical protein